jgi:serine/threonine protein kinase
MPVLSGCRSIDGFEKLRKIDEGTYGVVYRARDRATGEVVALKQIKLHKGQEGFPITSLREINILLALDHENIVNVREVVSGGSADSIFMVMDCLDYDLKVMMRAMRQPFSPAEVKSLLLQLLRATAYMHEHWVLHRDLKTSNLLMRGGTLNVCDFGMARSYGEPTKKMSSAVVTLHYRAPEILLGARLYTEAVDLWSVGCIFAELIRREPLLPGQGEVDQLDRVRQGAAGVGGVGGMEGSSWEGGMGWLLRTGCCAGGAARAQRARRVHPFALTRSSAWGYPACTTPCLRPCVRLRACCAAVLLCPAVPCCALLYCPCGALRCLRSSSCSAPPTRRSGPASRSCPTPSWASGSTTRECPAPVRPRQEHPCHSPRRSACAPASRPAPRSSLRTASVPSPRTQEEGCLRRRTLQPRAARAHDARPAPVCVRSPAVRAHVTRARAPSWRRYNRLKETFGKQRFDGGAIALTESGLDLLNGLLTYDPQRRLTAAEALGHAYFREEPPPKPSWQMPTFPQLLQPR